MSAIQWLRGNLLHLYHRAFWNLQWRNPAFKADWLVDGPREHMVAAMDDGWIAPPATILELGCGRGTGAAWLHERGFDVLAVDFSGPAIATARNSYPSSDGLTFEVADVCDPGFASGRTFDIIIDSGCLRTITTLKHQSYARNIRRWSRPGTRFMILTHYDPTKADPVGLYRDLFAQDFSMESDILRDPNGKPRLVIRMIRL